MDTGVLTRLEVTSGTRLGLCVRDRDGQVVLAYRAAEPVATASTIKVLVLAALWAAVRGGRLDWSTRVEVGAAQAVPGTGVLAQFEDGVHLSLRDLATAMIVLSDNVATNVLLEQLGGPAAVTHLATRLGLESVTMTSGVDPARLRYRPQDLGTASPEDLSLLMHLLHSGQVVDGEASAQMLSLLGRPTGQQHLARYLEHGHDPHALFPGVQVAAKSGHWPGSRAEIGVLSWSAEALTYAVSCAGSTDLGLDGDSQPSVILGLVGAWLMQHCAPAMVREEWASDEAFAPVRRALAGDH